MTIVFHAERRAGLNSNMCIGRYDHVNQYGGPAPTSGQPLYPGTPIWTGIDFYLPEGNYLLSTSGGLQIKHLYKPSTEVGFPANYPADYGLYANIRTALMMATTQAGLPVAGSCPDESTILELKGTNILNMSAHYAILFSGVQEPLAIPAGGRYCRVELWAGCGADQVARDDLGGLGFYNSKKVHQFNVRVETL